MSTRQMKAILKLSIPLMGGKHLSRKEIEKLLDVPDSTAHNYIDYLRKHFNAPIDYSVEGNYYYCSEPWDIMAEIEK